MLDTVARNSFSASGREHAAKETKAIDATTTIVNDRAFVRWAVNGEPIAFK
ncbi:MAG: hypothetical protein ACREBN_04505 [Burkholderiaceae bacterium]